jgi:hypothetical protein
MLNSAKDLVAAIPNSKSYAVSGVGHSFNFDAPELYSSIIHGWITDKEIPTDRPNNI